MEPRPRWQSHPPSSNSGRRPRPQTPDRDRPPQRALGSRRETRRSDPDGGTPSRPMPGTETGLPWTLTCGGIGLRSPDLENRRRLLTTGLAAIVLLLAGGGYLLWRVVQRELAVATAADRVRRRWSRTSSARRSTSLRHVTELLEEDDEMPPSAGTPFTSVLGRNTERLHRLVESLLDFARMEDGRKPYDFNRVDAATCDDGGRRFPRTSTAGRHSSRPRPSALTAVRSPMRRRSPTRSGTCSTTPSSTRRAAAPIRVSIRRTRRGVAIAVHDQGLGIPAHERGKSSDGSCAAQRRPARHQGYRPRAGHGVAHRRSPRRRDRARVGGRRREARSGSCSARPVGA